MDWTNGNKLCVGSKIVERGKVYKVYKILEKQIEGKTERVIYYKPYFINTRNDTLICSIPETSLKDTKIRTPISEEKVKEVFVSMKKRIRITKPLDTSEAKDTLNLNDIDKSVRVLKKYWREKKRNSDKFTKTKKDVLEMAIRRIVEEIALVENLSLEKAEEVILNSLGG
jgi:RNA polymerase-interacting CarD/CdnL/TRCF family regulator